MRTLVMCQDELSKKEQNILAKHPNVQVVLSPCDELDESQPVVFKLPEKVFYGQVVPERLVDVIVGRADDLKIQTARLYNVEMGKFQSEPIYRKLVQQFKEELEELTEFSATKLRKEIKAFVKSKNVKEWDLIAPLKIAVFGTTKGPDLSIVMELLGQKESLKLVDTFLSNYKYRI